MNTLSGPHLEAPWGEDKCFVLFGNPSTSFLPQALWPMKAERGCEIRGVPCCHRVKVQRGSLCQSLEDVVFAPCVASAIRDRACRLPCCPQQALTMHHDARSRAGEKS